MNIFDVVNVTLADVGRPPKRLVEKVNEKYTRANARYASFGNSDFNHIKSFINKQTPVMALIRVGEASVPIFSSFSDVPALHWIVVSGYDDQNVYYYNSSSGMDEYENMSGVNTERSMPISLFQSLWAWNWNPPGDHYDHGVVHNSLINSGILKPNTIIWLAPRRSLRTIQ